MGLSHTNSVGPDLKDVTLALHAFEKQNECKIILTTRSCGTDATPGIWWEAKAIGQKEGELVPKLLAFAQLSCGAANVRTMEAALLNLLYQLDFLLAEQEWQRAGKAEKPHPAH